MIDIVERLRYVHGWSQEMKNEAADEIETLRGQVAMLREALTELLEYNPKRERKGGVENGYWIDCGVALREVIEQCEEALAATSSTKSPTDAIDRYVAGKVEEATKGTCKDCLQVEEMLKMAYCRTKGADSIIGLDCDSDYKAWKNNLAEQLKRGVK